MIIYSVTVKPDPAIETDWCQWMQTVHIPDVIQSGYFEKAIMAKDTDGEGYRIEYHCVSMERYQAYAQEAAPALQEDHSKRYAGKFSASRKIYEVCGQF